MTIKTQRTARGRTASFPVRELPNFTKGRYRVRLAQGAEDLERVLRLRFAVFNLELGEGLEESFRTGLDRDKFDLACDHLMVLERSSNELVGTYRMQTLEMAQAGAGLYCDQEFDLAQLPANVVANGVELGRACIASEFRKGVVLHALWRGIDAYAQWTGKRHLFGCCSLTSQDPIEGWRMHWQLERDGHAPLNMVAPTRSKYACGDRDAIDPLAAGEVKLPRLFKIYLRYGARVCSGPALDRQFGTIDFLTVIDLKRVSRPLLQLFFHHLPELAP